MASKALEVPEESVPSREAPPSYSSIISPFGLEQLGTLPRVVVRPGNITTEHGDLIFGVKAELIKDGGSALCFDLYDRTGRTEIRLKPVNAFCTPHLKVHINGQYVAKLGLNSFISNSPTYAVSDAGGRKVLKILYTRGCHLNQYWLRLKDMQGDQVGAITTKWHGLPDDTFTDSKELQIDFYKDLGVQYRAAVIGLCVVLLEPTAEFWPVILAYIK